MKQHVFLELTCNTTHTIIPIWFQTTWLICLCDVVSGVAYIPLPFPYHFMENWVLKKPSNVLWMLRRGPCLVLHQGMCTKIRKYISPFTEGSNDVRIMAKLPLYQHPMACNFKQISHIPAIAASNGMFLIFLVVTMGKIAFQWKSITIHIPYIGMQYFVLNFY